MFTIATVQLHVQTPLDPSAVRVTILILEMEKRAISCQVNLSHFHSVLLRNAGYAIFPRYSEEQYMLFTLQYDIFHIWHTESECRKLGK